jgi:hypothetical protein
MSKVIHLSDDAHNKAKEFCRQHELKMSDWVAGLIAAAITHGDASVESAVNNVRSLVSKKKFIEHVDEAPAMGEDGLPVYASPPFWDTAAKKMQG